MYSNENGNILFDKKGNKIIVIVEEDSYVNFAFMSDIQSKSFNIANVFTFEQINGEYKNLYFDGKMPVSEEDRVNMLREKYSDLLDQMELENQLL